MAENESSNSIYIAAAHDLVREVLVLAKKGVSINTQFRRREIKPVSSSQALHQLKVIVEPQPLSSFL